MMVILSRRVSTLSENLDFAENLSGLKNIQGKGRMFTSVDLNHENWYIYTVISRSHSGMPEECEVYK